MEGARFRIRRAKPSDLPSLRRLAEELSAAAPRETVEAILGAGRPASQEIFVADGVELLGWIHVIEADRLTVGGMAEVVGLVVREDERRAGVGGSLVDAARSWARRRGRTRLRVRVRRERASARRFYEALGFETKKRQVVLDLPLDSG